MNNMFNKANVFLALVVGIVLTLLFWTITNYILISAHSDPSMNPLVIQCPEDPIDPVTERPYRAITVLDHNSEIVFDVVCNGNTNQIGTIYSERNIVFLDPETQKQHWIGSLATLKPSISDNIHCIAWMHPNRTIEYIAGDCPQDQQARKELNVVG